MNACSTTGARNKVEKLKDNEWKKMSGTTPRDELLEDRYSIQHLFDNNKKWREKKMEIDSTFFKRTAERQAPRYLWIGCSDSRVPAEEVTGLNPGEMFVHRNIANLVVSNDISSLSVIQFAVEKLKVQDIIVCGHYGCGGVNAAMENKELGLLDNWLRNIRDVCRQHQSELREIEDYSQRFRRVVEFNIIEQCYNIFKINMVQKHHRKYGFPRIHGLVYDIASGTLKELDIDYVRYLQQYSGIYRLHSYPENEIPRSLSQLRRNMILDLAEDHQEEEGYISAKYITRTMKQETDLFTPDEVDAAVAHARKDHSNPESPFISVDALISYFTVTPREG